MKVLKARLYDLELQKQQEKLDAVEAGEEGDRLRQPDPLLRAAPLPDGQGPPHQARGRRRRPRARRRPRRLHQGDARGQGEGHARPADGGRGLAAAEAPCDRRDGVARRAARRGCWPAGCRGRQLQRAARARPRATGRRPAWELVFEREVAGNLDLYVDSRRRGPGAAPHRRPGGGRPRALEPRTASGSSSPRKRTGHYQIYEVPAAGGAGPPRPRATRRPSTRPTSRRTASTLAFLSNLDGPGAPAACRTSRAGRCASSCGTATRHDLRQPALEPRRALHHLLVELADRPPDLRRGGGDRRRSAASRRLTGRRLRAALQPRRAEGRLREPRPPRPTSRLVEHDLASGEERALVVVAGPQLRPRLLARTARELAFASNITGEYAVYRQRLSDGQAWRVTFGPGPGPLSGLPPGGALSLGLAAVSGRGRRRGSSASSWTRGSVPATKASICTPGRARRARAAHLVHRARTRRCPGSGTPRPAGPP